MKINQVYLYKNTKLKNPYVVLTKKIKGGFYARRVTQVGGVSLKPMKISNKAKLIPVPEAKVYFNVEMPKRIRDKIRYQNLILRGIDIRKKYLASRKNSLEARKFRSDLVRLSFASFELNNVEQGRRYNLKDFATNMKFKNNAIFYKWVVAHLKSKYDKEHFKQIETCADRTLKTIVEHYRENLPCYLGFNKEIDQIITKHFKAYVKEYAKRGKNGKV